MIEMEQTTGIAEIIAGALKPTRCSASCTMGFRCCFECPRHYNKLCDGVCPADYKSIEDCPNFQDQVWRKMEPTPEQIKALFQTSLEADKFTFFRGKLSDELTTLT